jgi:hypothetical protein
MPILRLHTSYHQPSDNNTLGHAEWAAHDIDDIDAHKDFSDIGGLREFLGGRDAGWISPTNRWDGPVRILEPLADDPAVDAVGSHTRQRYLNAVTPPAVVAFEAVHAGTETAMSS